MNLLNVEVKYNQWMARAPFNVESMPEKLSAYHN